MQGAGWHDRMGIITKMSRDGHVARLDVTPAVRAVRAVSPAAGGVARMPATSDAPAYDLYLPASRQARARLLVLVHGISRNVHELVSAFRPLADLHGVALVAPLFDEEGYPGYQRLGLGARAGGAPRHDLVLRHVLAEARERADLPEGPFYMFGHSGGAQFTHRYAMAHPHDVARYALGAAGWYTMPDLALKFPKGMKVAAEAGSLVLDLEAFLRIPACVFAGTSDTERNEALRQSTFLDSTEGRTRVERAERWVAAITMAARWRGIDTPFRFQPVSGAGHDFTELAARGRIAEMAMAWFLDEAQSP